MSVLVIGRNGQKIGQHIHFHLFFFFCSLSLFTFTSFTTFLIFLTFSTFYVFYNNVFSVFNVFVSVVDKDFRISLTLLVDFYANPYSIAVDWRFASTKSILARGGNYFWSSDRPFPASHKLKIFFFVSALPGNGSAGKNGRDATRYVFSFFNFARVIWLSVDIGTIA